MITKYGQYLNLKRCYHIETLPLMPLKIIPSFRTHFSHDSCPFLNYSWKNSSMKPLLALSSIPQCLEKWFKNIHLSWRFWLWRGVRSQTVPHTKNQEDKDTLECFYLTEISITFSVIRTSRQPAKKMSLTAI